VRVGRLYCCWNKIRETQERTHLSSNLETLYAV